MIPLIVYDLYLKFISFDDYKLSNSNMLKEEFQYYLDNQEELVKKHDGKVLVIKDCKVVGIYLDEMSALFESEKKYTPGTFIIQRCSLGDKDYKAVYQSRVIFA